MKRTKLRPVSKKRAKENAVYFRKKKAFLKDHPLCEFLKQGTGSRYHSVERCANPSVDVHHANGRTGKNYLDDNTWFALCREHHTYIHDNPAWARKNGFITT